MLVFFNLSLTESKAFAQAAVEVAPLTIGQTLKFKSRVLDEERVLNVYLPASYKKNGDQKFPVIYVLDGSIDEDFIHIVGLAQFGAFSWIKMLPESIVVGIANVDRKRDFTSPPTNDEDKNDFPTAGGSSKFIQSLDEEVQPLINKQFRTNGTETIIGQSLGGLLATEILFTSPQLFDNYVIVSPSLWWNGQALLNSKLAAFEEPVSVFIGVGKEGEVMERDAKQLSTKLESAKSDQLKVSFQFFPELDHGDTLHLAVYKAFEAIFSKTEREK